MSREVPDEVLFKAFRDWMASLTAKERKVARDHFEQYAHEMNSLRGAQFLEILRKED